MNEWMNELVGWLAGLWSGRDNANIRSKAKIEGILWVYTVRFCCLMMIHSAVHLSGEREIIRGKIMRQAIPSIYQCQTRAQSSRGPSPNVTQRRIIYAMAGNANIKQ